jgi:hypothetical protein
MPSQDFERHYPSIAHKIADNFSVENLHCAIVARVCKQRVSTRMEFDCSDGFRMVTQGFVGTNRQVQIVPQQSSIIRANNEIVAARHRSRSGVDVEAANPSSTWVDDLDQTLAREIIYTNNTLIGDEKHRLAGMFAAALRP